MSTHNICFRGEIRKISVLFSWKTLQAMLVYVSLMGYVGCPQHTGFVFRL